MFAKFIFVALAATGLIFLCGCASLQLNYNTLDLASSLDDLVTKQILHNISATLDNPYAVPSQVAVAAGTVQTSNSVTPTLTSPLSNTRTATNTVAATITSAIATTVTGKSLSVSANDVWQQAWTLDPVSTDSDRARRLRALYRYVTNYYGSSGNPKHTPAAQFMCDYPIQSAAAPAQSSSPAGSQNTASNSFQTGVITANGYEIIRLTRVLRSAMKLKAWEKARIVEQNIEAVSSKLRAQAEAMPELAVLANQKLDEIQETLSKIAGDLTESEPIGLISETDQIESKIVQLISTLKNAGKEPAGSTKPSAAVTSILICPDGPHNISVDPNFIRRPGCVICFTGSGEPAGILDPTQLQVNDNLFFGFISKKPKDDDWQSLGVFGFPELFLHVCPIGVKTCGPGSIANGVEALNNLKLFVFEASAQSGGASQSGGKNSSKSLGAPFIVPPVGGEI